MIINKGQLKFSKSVKDPDPVKLHFTEFQTELNNKNNKSKHVNQNKRKFFCSLKKHLQYIISDHYLTGKKKNKKLQYWEDLFFVSFSSIPIGKWLNNQFYNTNLWNLIFDDEAIKMFPINALCCAKLFTEILEQKILNQKTYEITKMLNYCLKRRILFKMFFFINGIPSDTIYSSLIRTVNSRFKCCEKYVKSELELLNRGFVDGFQRILFEIVHFKKKWFLENSVNEVVKSIVRTVINRFLMSYKSKINFYSFSVKKTASVLLLELCLVPNVIKILLCEMKTKKNCFFSKLKKMISKEVFINAANDLEDEKKYFNCKMVISLMINLIGKIGKEIWPMLCEVSLNLFEIIDCYRFNDNYELLLLIVKCLEIILEFKDCCKYFLKKSKNNLVNLVSLFQFSDFYSDIVRSADRILSKLSKLDNGIKFFESFVVSEVNGPNGSVIQDVRAKLDVEMSKLAFCNSKRKNWSINKEAYNVICLNGKDKDSKKLPVDVPLLCCNNCEKKGRKLKKCSRCKLVNYCSRECQRKNWALHKKKCKKFNKK